LTAAVAASPIAKAEDASRENALKFANIQHRIKSVKNTNGRGGGTTSEVAAQVREDVS
jgi:hypothetical protein